MLLIIRSLYAIVLVLFVALWCQIVIKYLVKYNLHIIVVSTLYSVSFETGKSKFKSRSNVEDQDFRLFFPPFQSGTGLGCRVGLDRRGVES